MDQIGRYRVTGELGRGGMGIVYDAVDPLIGRNVAIKTIRLDTISEPGEAEFLRERLFREARSAGALSHPNIVTIYDVGQQDEIAFIAMERVEGPSLQQLLGSAEKPGLADVLGVLRQTAAALDYAHQNGVIHRDVKPANIMLHKGMNVKVADFGIAKLVSSQKHTRTGVMMGTPSYMAPEQINSAQVDGRADQFALGVVAYEVLTGTRPFDAESLSTLVHMIVYRERPSASATNPSLPAAVDQVLRRVLAIRPDERYSSCVEFITELECAVTGTPRLLTPAHGYAFSGTPVPATPVPATPVPAQPVAAHTMAAPPLYAPPPVYATPFPAGGTAVPPKPFPIIPVAIGVGVVALLAMILVSVEFGPSLIALLSPGPPPPAPVISQFTVDYDAPDGKKATLRWEVGGATEVSINHGIGKVQPSATVDVTRTTPTIYVMTATSKGGTVSAQVSVDGPGTVAPPPEKAKMPRILTFHAQPKSVAAGGQVKLVWSVAGKPDTVTIEPGLGTVVVTGARSVTVVAATTYTLTATSTGGTVKEEITVTVEAAKKTK